MNLWIRRFLVLGIGLLVFGGILFAASFAGVDFLVDFWWFESLEYLFYFSQRLLYRYVILASVTLAFFLIFFLNFWVASRYLGTTSSDSGPERTKAYANLFNMFRTGSLAVYTPLSVILAVVMALPLFQQWEMFLLYVFGAPTQTVDPVYGLDISYYLFQLPIYTLVQGRLLIVFALLLLALIVLYWLERRLLSQQDQRLPMGAKVHLCILILFTFFIEIWDFTLQAQRLVYSDSHLPLFYGPGYVEMWIIRPLIWLSLFLLMGTAFSLIAFILKRKGLKPLAFFAVAFFLVFGARYSPFLPNLVQKYVVKPNEISKEKPYIERNIEATLKAYSLDDVETRDVTPERIPVDIADPRIKVELRNIPVWDGELLEDVYESLQQLRNYYNFSDVDVDRYKVNNVTQQVFLAARELDHSQLTRNWLNDHLSYTHGYGAVMTPASQGGDEPMTWFLRGIPPESEYGFSTEQPGIYFGLGKYTYVIAPNDAGEIDYPKGSTNVMTNYHGRGGVPLSSMFRKAMFSYYFRDKDLLFTTKTNAQSRILIRQNIVELIRTVTPFLVPERDPYLVITPQKLFWIQDAYTVSDRYPNSTPFVTPQGSINYIRNSVKIVVDAYDGTVDYYIFDDKDPFIRAYNSIYPGLFKDKSKMPADLMAQVRYPQDIFTIQMSIYAKYQQTDPEVFFQQEDMWEFAKTYRGKEIMTITPYYLTLDIIDPSRFDFLLLVPMSPKGRDNLRALTVVGCDPPYYGKIIVYNFPKGELIYGPSQIYAMINQDTKVSEQFTLWDQVGSEVARGKMIILPVGRVILYIQPVYLKSSTQLKIPELKRLIMSQGQVVVMESSLEEA